MLLTVNANNTNTKFALVDDRRIVDEWRTQTVAARTADEYIVWLAHLMQLRGFAVGDVSDVVIASVVPQANFNLHLLARGHFKAQPLVLGDPDCELGIKVLATPPVGADRLANTVGGHLKHPGALVVVDFGTATTFDIKDEQGNYCGGVIAPGINLSLEALHRATAMLPRIAVEAPATVIGTNTLACMQSGVYWGYVGLIEGIVQRIKAEWGRPMKVVATGGLAPLFRDATPAIEGLEPDITTHGLVEIWHRNRGRS
jgi:type III pantothenate kinase